MLSLKKMLSRILPAKRREKFLKLLKGDNRPKVAIKNAIVGSTFQVYNPAAGHMINAAMLHQGMWAVWTTTQHGSQTLSPMNHFTNDELCAVIEREMTTLYDGAELTIVDPGKHLSFYGKTR